MFNNTNEQVLKATHRNVSATTEGSQPDLKKPCTIVLNIYDILKYKFNSMKHDDLYCYIKYDYYCLKIFLLLN